MTIERRNFPQFFITAPSPCPYLPNRLERKVLPHLVGPDARNLNSQLSHGGFRRSQNIAYRPACDGCQACVSVRVPVEDFAWSRGFRKIMAKNADLRASAVKAEATSEQYSLFRAYIDTRHSDGGMADMTVLDYAMMVEDSHVKTRLVEYRKRDADSGVIGRSKGDIVACVLTDILSDGLSLVYSFYEPDQADRSLGTLVILDHIARAKTMGLPYVYLGYWVEGSRKMDYKARFLPQERLSPDGWVRVEAP